MIRRDFIKISAVGICSLFGLDRIIECFAQEPEIYSKYGLGKYIGHYLDNMMYGPIIRDSDGNLKCSRIPGFHDDYIKPKRYKGYIDFPVEARLTIEYEFGSECYCRFNLTRKVWESLRNIKEIINSLPETGEIKNFWRLNHISYNNKYPQEHANITKKIDIIFGGSYS